MKKEELEKIIADQNVKLQQLSDLIAAVNVIKEQSTLNSQKSQAIMDQAAEAKIQFDAHKTEYEKLQTSTELQRNEINACISQSTEAKVNFDLQKTEYEELKEEVHAFWLGNPDNKGIKEQINLFWEGSDDEKGMKDNINDFKNYWFGIEKKGQISGGKRDEIDLQTDQINDYISKVKEVKKDFNAQKIKYKEWTEKVNYFWVGNAKHEGIKEQMEEFWLGPVDPKNDARGGGIKHLMNTMQSDMLNFWRGKANKETSERVGGFENEVTNLRDEIIDYWEGNENDSGVREGGRKLYIEKRLEDVEKLLSGSTSVALAEGYSQQSDDHRIRSEKYSRSIARFSIFSISVAVTLLIMMGIFVLLPKLIIFFVDIDSAIGSSLISQLSSPISFTSYLLIATTTLSVIGFIVLRWRGLIRNEREEIILQSEYAHKKALTLILDGYRRSIETLESESGKESLERLYDELIRSASYNPSLRLKQKGEETILHQMVENLNEMLKEKKSRDITQGDD